MAEKSAHSSQHPNPYAPCRGESRGDGYVDGDEPEVAGCTVEDAAESGLLAGHACQLSVAAVVGVGPDEQQDADGIELQVVEAEHNAGTHSEEDGENGHCVGRHAKLLEQQGPCIAHRAIEIDVYMLFRIGRFQCRTITFSHFSVFLFLVVMLMFCSCYFFPTTCITHWAMSAAAWLRQGPKLGQSLKSIMVVRPLGATTQSPP